MTVLHLIRTCSMTSSFHLIDSLPSLLIGRGFHWCHVSVLTFWALIRTKPSRKRTVSDWTPLRLRPTNGDPLDRNKVPRVERCAQSHEDCQTSTWRFYDMNLWNAVVPKGISTGYYPGPHYTAFYTDSAHKFVVVSILWQVVICQIWEHVQITICN